MIRVRQASRYALNALFLCMSFEFGHAEEVPADLDAHCRSVYGSTARMTIRRTDNAFLCAVRTEGGFGLKQYVLDIARVCAALDAKLVPRRDGNTLVCRDASSAPSTKSAIDLKSHCEQSYGRNTILTEQLATGKPMCSIRTENGFGLEHRIIDTSALCSPGQVEGISDGVLNCSAGNDTRASHPQGNDFPPKSSEQDEPSPETETAEETSTPSPRQPNMDDSSDWIPQDGELFALHAAPADRAPGVDSGLRIRIEVDGSRVSGVVVRSPAMEDYYGLPDVIENQGQHFAKLQTYPLLIQAWFQNGLLQIGRTVFSGTIAEGQVVGTESFYRMGFNVVIPDAPGSCTENFIPSFTSDSSAWHQVTATIGNGTISFPVAILLLRSEGVFADGAQYVRTVNCRSEVLSSPIQSVVTLVSLLNVEKVEFVDSDDTEKVLEELSAGQKMRVRVTVDRDATGRMVSVELSSGTNTMVIEALCGRDPSSKPRICLSRQIEISR